MRVLVVDDEPLARESLQRILREEDDIEIVGEAGDGVTALEQISQQQPDAVFLDIEMPGLNGFEVLDNLPKPPLVVFATAYDEFAIRAFEANAVDYLLKPIRPERVSKAITRLRDVKSRESPDDLSNLKKLLGELRPQTPRRVAVRNGQKIVLLSPREIVHVSAEDKLVFVHTAREKYMTDKTVTEMEDLLGKAGFFRVNRGDLVNLEAVRELMPWFSGTWRLKLLTGVEIDVSRERARHLKKLLNI